MIDHFGGIVVSRHAVLGDDCRIRNGVSISGHNPRDVGAPRVGNNVDIGTGAHLVGPITIGDNVIIGANAVVTVDVPPDSLAVGVPAVIKPRRHLAHSA